MVMKGQTCGTLESFLWARTRHTSVHRRTLPVKRRISINYYGNKINVEPLYYLDFSFYMLLEANPRNISASKISR